ncbi:MAG: histidine phosphatase family protein [Pseudobacteriovorax sp.]|nr:histidine phosphatase family protein [Pseudobacteriovorax sp.]
MTDVFLLGNAQPATQSTSLTYNPGLSETGAVQSLTLTPFLDALSIDYLYTSPFLMCRETITPFAKNSSILINIHQSLKDCIAPVNAKDYRESVKAFWKDTSAGHFKKARSRLIDTILKICENHPQKRILICMHSHMIALALNHYDKSLYGAEFAHKVKCPDLFSFTVQNQAFRSIKHIDLSPYCDTIPQFAPLILSKPSLV